MIDLLLRQVRAAGGVVPYWLCPSCWCGRCCAASTGDRVSAVDRDADPARLAGCFGYRS